MNIEQLQALIDEYAGGSQAQFALLIKKSPSQVNQWLKGIRPMGAKIERDIEEKLKIKIRKRKQNSHSLNQWKLIPYFNDPARAGVFTENNTTHSLEDADDYLPAPIQGVSDECFATPMRGESMLAPDGYSDGEILYIDPQATATSGKDVLTKLLGSNKYTFKRYKVDDQGPYLLALNGNHTIRPAYGFEVCGVCIFSGVKR